MKKSILLLSLMSSVSFAAQPEITILGENPEFSNTGGFTPGMPYVDAGATAYDAEDGDLTPYIQTTVTGDPIFNGFRMHYNFSVIDSDGNSASETRLVCEIGYYLPVIISVLGDLDVTINVGDAYVDAGATARRLEQLECTDTDATQLIMVTNTVDAAIAGDYSVSYTILDMYNPVYNQTYTRVVHVIGDTSPGGGGDDDGGDDGGGDEWESVEYTSKNNSHKRAGRASKSGGSFYAVGSNDYLGNRKKVTTLCESYEGYYELSSCD